VTKGGSGAGMTGVALGVLDVGAAGSYTSVQSAISSYPSANLQAYEVGGSAIVIIENSGTGKFLTDGVNPCVEVTQAALNTIYSSTTDASGYFTINANGCGTVGSVGVLLSTSVTPNVASTVAGAIQVVSRSDLPSGAEDTFYDYVFSSTSSNIATPLPGATEAGDTGVLSYVQSHIDSIGFVDLGFAEGQTAALAQSVSIPQVSSVALGAALDACSSGSLQTVVEPTQASYTASDCYVLTGQSTANLHTFVGTSLSTAAPSSSKPIYPDITSGTGVAAFGLTRTFWLVTAGAPDASAQQFITFAQSPANQGFWSNDGFFSVYQLTPITPP
jgi:ABC-type phosphate transport system substrate-binding protein